MFWKKKKAFPESMKTGAVAVKMGLASQAQLTEALAHQKVHGGLIGEALIALGVVSSEELDAVLDVQRKMREGDPVGANLCIVEHQTKTMRRSASQVTLMVVPNSHVG